MGGSGSVQETSAQKALAENAQLKWNDYKTRWLPVQQKLASQIQALSSKTSPLRTEAEGHAATDSAIQFANAENKAQAALGNRGVMPGAGKFTSTATGMSADAAKSAGLNEVLSDQMVNDAYTSGLTALMGIGQGQSAAVGKSLADQARASGVQAQADAQASLQNAETNAEIVGSGVGFGIQQYGSSAAPPVVNGSNPNGYKGVLNNPSAFVAGGV